MSEENRLRKTIKADGKKSLDLGKLKPVQKPSTGNEPNKDKK